MSYSKKPKPRLKKPNCTKISNSCGYACISKGENCEIEVPQSFQKPLTKKADELKLKPKPQPKQQTSVPKPKPQKRLTPEKEFELLQEDYKKRAEEGKLSRSPETYNYRDLSGPQPVTVTVQKGVDKEGKPILETKKFMSDRPGFSTVWHSSDEKEPALPQSKATFSRMGVDKFGTPYVTLLDIVFSPGEGKGTVREDHVNVYLNSEDKVDLFKDLQFGQKVEMKKGFFVESYRSNPSKFEEDTVMRYGVGVDSGAEFDLIDDYSEPKGDIINTVEHSEVETMNEQYFWSIFDNNRDYKKLSKLANDIYLNAVKLGKLSSLSDDFMLTLDSLSSPSNPI